MFFVQGFFWGKVFYAEIFIKNCIALKIKANLISQNCEELSEC
jgi:hypothetical protein